MTLLILISLSFPVPERLNYGGYYGLLRVGSSYMEIGNPEILNGKPVYPIECSQKTEGLFSIFFYLKDYYCSYVDTVSLSSVRFIKKIHEGNYQNEVTLDFESDSVLYSDGKKVPKIQGAKDMFAAIYYMRSLKFSPGDTLRIPFHSSKENHEMTVSVSGPFKMKTPAGEYETYQLTPTVPKGKIFGSTKPLNIWVSTDSLHIPVKIETQLKFGTIGFILESIELDGKE
ncbi:DUF3108 domain-containing protein [candidate division WOR-3 bacterium]|nr:DUF3108 domain-containing protein [candidate division WOR-3 bacterium]